MARHSLGRPGFENDGSVCTSWRSISSSVLAGSKLALGRQCGRPALVDRRRTGGVRVGGRRSRRSWPLADTVGARPRDPAKRRVSHGPEARMGRHSWPEPKCLTLQLKPRCAAPGRCEYQANSSASAAARQREQLPPLPLHFSGASRFAACGPRPAFSMPATRTVPASCTRPTLPSLGRGVGCPKCRLRPTVTVHPCLRSVTHSSLRALATTAEALCAASVPRGPGPATGSAAHSVGSRHILCQCGCFQSFVESI